MAITFWKSKLGRKQNNRTGAGRQEAEANGVKSFKDQQQKEVRNRYAESQ